MRDNNIFVAKHEKKEEKMKRRLFTTTQARAHFQQEPSQNNFLTQIDTTKQDKNAVPSHLLSEYREMKEKHCDPNVKFWMLNEA